MINYFKYKNDSHPKIRRGQLITTFGPGALINLEQGTFMAMGINSWPKTGNKDILYDERLQKQLNVRYFRQPPSSEEFPKGVPYRRFPRWLFCPKCRLLKTYEKWTTNDERKFLTQPRCNTCRKGLVPMSFLVACRKGHLDDFPWVWWVHRGESCSPDPTLKYETSLAGAGLSGSRIRCTQCDVKPRSMQGAFDPNAFPVTCRGALPWSKEKDVTEKCGERIVTVQRGGSNVYFPRMASSITIPPYTDTLFESIKETDHWRALMTAEGILDNDPEIKNKFLEKIAEQVGRSFEEVKSCVNKMSELLESSGPQNEDDYRFDEYQAFHGKFDISTNNKYDFDVVPAKMGSDYARYGIENIFLVRSLREIRALIGFTRLRPLETDTEHLEGEEHEVSELVSLTDNPNHPANWKPAVEVRGEGIFITLDLKKVKSWIENKLVIKRVEQMNNNYEISCRRRKINFKPVTAKYVLLHTFSHLLIRQLSFESGYSGASLRERIYCDSVEGENKMQGILIYTAAGDADGTLGGLVRQANPERFASVLESMTETSGWCANDPLCIESKGQGFESLNMSACYACALLPETSCEEFNKFLDRALLVGTPEFPGVGFLNINSL